MSHAVIVSAVRTPIGSFLGSLSALTAPQLGAVALCEAVVRAKISPDHIQEVVMGCVLSGGVGQAPARQAMIGAGVPTSAAALTLNKVCGSGLKSVMLADQGIRAGDFTIAVAGGMESMSNAPYLLAKARGGYKMGNGALIDGMIHDGLWDPYGNCHMGNIGELCAREQAFTREMQDTFALESYARAHAAVNEGKFAEEIVVTSVPQGKSRVDVATDEEPARVNLDKFRTLKPVFDPSGTITAGNASSLSDGAAALVVMEEVAAKKLGAPMLARIVAQATASQAPEWFTTAPAAAIDAVCKRAGLKISDIDLFEINEAFACVSLHAIKTCGLDPKKVNVHGGAIALGHPIGASGARTLVTLVHALHRYEKRFGLVSLCIGGGEATAMIIERL